MYLLKSNCTKQLPINTHLVLKVIKHSFIGDQIMNRRAGPSNFFKNLIIIQ